MARKAKFYKGQLIRRQIRENVPIGQYMIVQVVEKDRIYAEIIGCDTPNVMILKKNVYKCTIGALCISEDVFKRLYDGSTICVQHIATKLWLKACDAKPELIRFYTQRMNYQAIFVIESITRTTSLGESMVRIIVDRRL